MASPIIAFLWPEADFAATGVRAPAGYGLRFAPANDRAALEAACRDADFIVAASGFGEIDKAVLDAAPNLQLVQFTGAGYDNVDRDECARRGIPVGHLPGLNAPAVAQLIVQLAFRLRRPLPLLDTGGADEWQAARAANLVCEDLAGQVGIIGYGRIGRLAAGHFQGLGLDVVRAVHGSGDDSVPRLALAELLESSDIISISLPLTDTTRGLLGPAEIARMKPHAVLINVGRGGIVDEPAVADALTNGRLAGAAFDVFATEPLAPEHPFLALADEVRARLILTPHIAGQTRQSKARNFAAALDSVGRIAAGQPLAWPIPAD